MLSNAQTNSRFEIWDDSEIAQENQTEWDEFAHVPNETLEFKNTLKLNKCYHSASFIVNKVMPIKDEFYLKTFTFCTWN